MIDHYLNGSTICIWGSSGPRWEPLLDHSLIDSCKSLGPVLCAKPHDQSMRLNNTGAEIHYFSFHPSWVISVGPLVLIISKCASVTSKHWFWCYCLVLYRTYPIFFSFDSLSTIWRRFLLPSVHLHFFLFQNETLLIFFTILYDMNLSDLSSLLQEKDVSICIHFDCHTVIFFRYLYVWHFPHCLQLTQW